MDLSRAISNVEYKIATEQENFDAGRTIKMDINDSWPEAADLSDALARKYPGISITYDHQPNDRLQLLIRKEQ